MIIVLALALWVGVIALMANVTAWAFNIVVTGVFAGPGPIDGWTGLAINVLFSIVLGRGYYSDRIDR